MPTQSPSPANTTTFRLGSVSFSPVATGIDRPCIVWATSASTNTGIQAEQPMPLAKATSSLIPSSSIARMSRGDDSAVSAALAEEERQSALCADTSQLWDARTYPPSIAARISLGCAERRPASAVPITSALPWLALLHLADDLAHVHLRDEDPPRLGGDLGDHLDRGTATLSASSGSPP